MSSSSEVVPVAVLVSGSGSNLAALIDYQARPDCKYEIVAVLSDRPNIYALTRAVEADLPAEVVDWTDFDDRESFTSELFDVVEKFGAELVVLAGFMRILSEDAVMRFPNRIVNTHPSLLPAFPGAHAIADALDHGVKMTGVTMHLVDEMVDHGPILTQESVRVLEGDDEDSLRSRIQSVEHRLYPSVVNDIASELRN